jgi:hypothetical protein
MQVSEWGQMLIAAKEENDKIDWSNQVFVQVFLSTLLCCLFFLLRIFGKLIVARTTCTEFLV